MRSLLVTLAFLMSAAILLVACGSPEAPRAEYNVTGVIQSIDRDNNRVVISHEAVPGYMEAMVMSFPVSDPELLVGLESGDTVMFHMLVLPPGQGLLITEIAVKDTPPPDPASR